MTDTATNGRPRIGLIGAGGMSFGPSMVLDAIRSTRLPGATLVLHDIGAGRLERVTRTAGGDHAPRDRDPGPRVQSALDGDPDKALEAIRRDPNSPPTPAACRALFDELRGLQAAALPF